MNSGVKSIRNLMVPLALLIVLVAAFFISRALLTRETSDASESQQTEYQSVVSLVTENLYSVSVSKNGVESFTISRTDALTNNGRWNLSEPLGKYDSELFSDNQMEQYLYSMINILSERTLSVNSEALVEYGLDNPSCVITYRLNDGTIVRLDVGRKTADEKYTYVRVGSEGPVFVITAETADSFDASILDFFNKSALNHLGKEIESLRFTRRSNPVSILANPSKNRAFAEDILDWRLVLPVEYTSGDTFNSLAYCALTLEIDEYVEDSTDAVAQYGLSEPEYVFVIEDADGNVTHIYVSREMSGKYYGYSDAMPGIFRISSNRFKGLDAPIIEYYYAYPIKESVSVIKSVKALFPEGEFSLEMNLSENMSINHPDAIAIVNRRPAKVTDQSDQSYFMILFDSIMDIRFSGIDAKAPSSGAPEISVRIVSKDNRVTLLEFSNGGDGHFQVYLDGTFTGFTVSTEQFYSENRTEPGVWFAFERLNEALDGQINGKYDIPVS